MNDDFYAVIKLISGEEIFSKVCPCEEDDRTLLILENPITVEKIYLKRFNLPIAKISPWIKLSDDSMFIIDMEKVLTITESNDIEMIEAHKKYIRDRDKKSNKSEFTPNMGYVSTVSEAREFLEKIFNL
jgi:hypothetical protein